MTSEKSVPDKIAIGFTSFNGGCVAPFSAFDEGVCVTDDL
ncbi:hypothetical Protein YC6258_03705 [Gynuella sunshinyii YC6258]|uniref:Uncharacterized protein n=1 Tax=Gynuella sunshinyii YC6258 TaxID=1445510 RepID=A0A0C5VN78_9GAMM|nr:hypothetical Protein YC6258_03705 [Gynuella sunshinyii YC6258]